MIIFGAYNKKIKQYYDNALVCEFCGNVGLNFAVYKQCVHLFWIPVFPVSAKSIVCTCARCGAECGGGGKKEEYLSRTRTPLYMFTLLILFFMFTTWMAFMNIENGKNKILYINEPKAGDVYVIRDKGGDALKYYFFKVKEVTAESIIVYHGALEYKKFVSRMNNDDYFVTNDEIEIFRDDLKQYLNDGVINYVERGYGKSSNFNNEEEVI